MTSDVVRVTVEGTALTGEVWSVNPCFGIGDFSFATPTFAQANAAAAAIAALTPGSQLLAAMSTGLRITGARVEVRKFDGTLDVVGEATRSSSLPGTGAPVHPPQIAMCHSLRTARAGASYRGRLYWPGVGLTIQSTDFRVSSATQDSLLSDLKTYLTSFEGAINTAFVETGASLVVWSRKDAALEAVNALSVGNVLDTQRRRRDKLTESLVTLAF